MELLEQSIFNCKRVPLCSWLGVTGAAQRVGYLSRQERAEQGVEVADTVTTKKAKEDKVLLLLRQ